LGGNGRCIHEKDALQKEAKFGWLSLKIDTKEDMATMGRKGQTIIVFCPLDIQSYRRDINTHRLNYGVK